MRAREVTSPIRNEWRLIDCDLLSMSDSTRFRNAETWEYEIGDPSVFWKRGSRGHRLPLAVVFHASVRALTGQITESTLNSITVAPARSISVLDSFNVIVGSRGFCHDTEPRVNITLLAPL
jgi:hypothetical protein